MVFQCCLVKTLRLEEYSGALLDCKTNTVGVRLPLLILFAFRYLPIICPITVSYILTLFLHSENSRNVKTCLGCQRILQAHSWRNKAHTQVPGQFSELFKGLAIHSVKVCLILRLSVRQSTCLNWLYFWSRPCNYKFVELGIKFTNYFIEISYRLLITGKLG